MNIQQHGGNCCGVVHLYSFPGGMTKPQRRNKLKSDLARVFDDEWFSAYDDDEDDPENWRCCVEVVLVESQLRDWCPTLEEAGFKQVFSFLNSNSGNECHVFLLETNRPIKA